VTLLRGYGRRFEKCAKTKAERGIADGEGNHFGVCERQQSKKVRSKQLRSKQEKDSQNNPETTRDHRTIYGEQIKGE
jgi:hypothetical protein